MWDVGSIFLLKVHHIWYCVFFLKGMAYFADSAAFTFRRFCSRIDEGVERIKSEEAEGADRAGICVEV